MRRLIIFCVFVFSLPLTTFAQGSWKELVTPAGAEFDVIGAEKVGSEQALQLLEEGAVFIDVRRATPFSLAHIPGAVNLDVNSALTEQSLLDYVPSRGQAVVFYCSDARCDRSARASAMAVFWGFEHVVYYADGWSAWIARNYPRD